MSITDWRSHGRAIEAENAALKNKVRDLENTVVQLNSICDWIKDAIESKAVSDFGESFPLVRAAIDLKIQEQSAVSGAAQAAMELAAMRNAIAARSRELQRAAAENAVMREALEAEKGRHSVDCGFKNMWRKEKQLDPECGCTARHRDERIDRALATPSPRAAQLLAVVEAAKRVERGLSRSRAGDRVDVCANGTDPLDAFDLLALLRDVLAALESDHE